MPLEAGTSLGHYTIAAPLGAGGMGEVYRAQDTKLDREVAIKVLPEGFAADEERVARFEREAKVLASLNHPHIGHIYGLEEADGVHALVLELVEGPTLADRITEGPIPLEEALSIARQIAEALEAAHEQGIIHRDLKPANVKVRPDGTVKVLDFGLAKTLLRSPGSEDPTVSQSPTITAGATELGVVMGTAAYMAPEQARGQLVDKRADIWAFGCVLYEMLSGRRLFETKDVADTLASVLTKEVDWGALPATLPVRLRRLLDRCLRRDSRQRLRDIGEARFELEELRSAPTEEGDPGPATSPVSRWRMTVLSVAMLMLGAVISGFAAWRLLQPDDSPVQRFDVSPSDTQSGLATNSGLAISPNGRLIAMVSAGTPQKLHLRSLDRLDVRTLEGLGSPRYPFFSPDGEWIAFVDGTNLKKVNINGGPASEICNTGGTGIRGATWADDGTIYFATNQSPGILRVAASGGEPEPLTTTDERSGEVAHTHPEALPAGDALLFTVFSGGIEIESAQIEVLDLESRERTVVVRGGMQPRFLESGHIAYAAAGELWAVPFDAARREVRGDPIRVLEDVQTAGSLRSSIFAVALDDGSLVYTPGSAVAAHRRLVWVDRQGQEQPIGLEPRPYVQARISPDGGRVALDIRDRQSDIWIWDFAGEALTRLTFDPGRDRQPVWSPDGRRIAFSSERDAPGQLYWLAADGTGDLERLRESPHSAYPTSFSADGKGLVIWEATPETGLDIAHIDLEGERDFQPIIKTSFDERNAELSPDGGWIAYQSNESGSDEVYVQPFPDVSDGRWQVSNGGGSRPMWSPDGRELYFMAQEERLMVVPVAEAESWMRQNPEELFEKPYPQPLFSRTFDISPDGERFLMIKEEGADGENTPSVRVVLVQNWSAELERLLPEN